jgi:trehalose synthase
MTVPPPVTESGNGYAVRVVQPEPTSDVLPEPPLRHLADRVRGQLNGARIWHVNSTDTGGGVAELLHSGISRQQRLGLPAGWLVSDAAAGFFQLTKRIHHGLHGHPPGGQFDRSDLECYRSASERQAAGLLAHIQAGDLVVLHDPQTLGAAPGLVAAGALVAWRSHIGVIGENARTDATWRLLRSYLEPVRHCVFTVAEYAPEFLQPERVHVIRPSIDPWAAKNRELPEPLATGLLARTGLTDGTGGPEPAGRTLHDAPLPAGAQVLLQVSRWDPLKDMAGVLQAFAAHLADRTPAHLVLAGPDPADIPDDPEGLAVYQQVRQHWQDLPGPVRARVHLVMLSLRDHELNAMAVNALQRRATVVSQKSLQEGFGLTVTEAMWKSRPVVASRVGGITAQITSREVGLLVDDPTDLRRFGDAVLSLLTDPAYAARIGTAAHRHCANGFLSEREIGDYLRLYLAMLAG